MKIDLDWIQEELDAGREVELECIDEEGLLSDYTDSNKELLRGALTVEEVKNHAIYIKNCTVGIVDNEFKHFHIKQYPTFDDLIDVAVQAKKDGIISEIRWDNDQYLSVFCADGIVVSVHEEMTSAFIRNSINYIKSLYTETFVIESVEDIARSKRKAIVELANGNTFIVDTVSDSYLISTCGFDKLTLLVLKGATVTQKR